MIDSKLITLAIVLLVLDISWLKMVMSARYDIILSDILCVPKSFNYIAAILTYIIMIFGLYWFVVRNSNKKNEALINGALRGLVMYGVYDGTLYSVFPIKDKMTGLMDVLWGVFVCGISSYIAVS